MKKSEFNEIALQYSPKRCRHAISGDEKHATCIKLKGKRISFAGCLPGSSCALYLEDSRLNLKMWGEYYQALIAAKGVFIRLSLMYSVNISPKRG
jgi:hypothetical protein